MGWVTPCRQSCTSSQIAWQHAGLCLLDARDGCSAFPHDNQHCFQICQMFLLAWQNHHWLGTTVLEFLFWVQEEQTSFCSNLRDLLYACTDSHLGNIKFQRMEANQGPGSGFSGSLVWPRGLCPAAPAGSHTCPVLSPPR